MISVLIHVMRWRSHCFLSRFHVKPSTIEAQFLELFPFDHNFLYICFQTFREWDTLNWLRDMLKGLRHVRFEIVFLKETRYPTMHCYKLDYAVHGSKMVELETIYLLYRKKIHIVIEYYYFDNDNFQHVENIMYDVVKQIYWKWIFFNLCSN